MTSGLLNAGGKGCKANHFPQHFPSPSPPLPPPRPPYPLTLPASTASACPVSAWYGDAYLPLPTASVSLGRSGSRCPRVLGAGAAGAPPGPAEDPGLARLQRRRAGSAHAARRPPRRRAPLTARLEALEPGPPRSVRGDPGPPAAAVRVHPSPRPYCNCSCRLSPYS